MKKKLIVLGILAAFVLSVGITYAVWPPNLSRIPKVYYNPSASWDGRRLLGLAWYRLLTHTHSGGFEQGQPIGTAGLADSAVTSAKIADGTVGTADLANDSVTSAKIAADTIAAADIATGAVTTAEILDGTIATADIATGAITTALIADGTITNADVSATAAIAYSKLALTGSIATADLVDGAVTSAKILDGTIATADLADSAVTSAKIADGTITNADISATAAIANTKLANPNAYYTVSLTMTRQLTASLASAFRFRVPVASTLVSVGASARASGGTTPTLSVDVKEAGVTVLSAPFAVTAGAWSTGTVTDSAIAAANDVTVDFTIGGTLPTWDDITLLLTFKTAHVN